MTGERLFWITIDPALSDALDVAAAWRGLSRDDYIRRVVEEAATADAADAALAQESIDPGIRTAAALEAWLDADRRTIDGPREG